MNFLNIRIYKKNEGIIIQFDTVINEHELYAHALSTFAKCRYTFPLLCNKIKSDTIFQHELQVKSLDNIWFIASYEEQLVRFRKEVDIYTLPANPLAAFYFFQEIEKFLHPRLDEKQPYCVLINGAPIEDNLQEYSLTTGQAVNHSNSVFSRLRNWLISEEQKKEDERWQIKQLNQPLDTYLALAHRDVNVILNTVFDEVLNMCSKDAYRDMKPVLDLLRPPISEVPEPKVQGEIKIQCLLAVARRIINKNSISPKVFAGISPEEISEIKKLERAQITSELQFLLNSVIVLEKQRLWALCMGKTAYDKNPYGEDHTEFDVLNPGEFGIGPDGLMWIMNLANNPGLKEHYAEGSVGPNDFADEMRFLMPLLGLALDESSDFKEKIVFDRQSTEILKAKGLHLDVNYLKKLLYARNVHSIFNNIPADQYEFSLPPELNLMVAEQMISSQRAPLSGEVAQEDDQQIRRMRF